MLILVANQKGGVGKSTIAAHTAVRIALMDYSVVLADADPQRTSWQWTRRRATERPGAVTVPGEVLGADLAGAIPPLAEQYRHIVIDAPGADTDALRTALGMAHRIIIPSRVATRDLEALPPMAERVREANEHRSKPIRPRVVFNAIRALPNFWSRVDEARSQVEAMGFDVCQRAIVDRLIYDDCQRDGGTVFDDRWDNKAIDEMNSVLRELLRSPQMNEETPSE
jgi:chromosome partitioning protein